jgi:hypothetical protein
MNIDSYSFGKMVIDGQSYRSDLIIYPERIDSSWWRKEGHLLRREDLTDIIAANPEVLIIGTGYMGAMKVPEELRKQLMSMKIELHVENSRQGAKVFNAIHAEKRTIAAFHLTC